MNKSIIFSFFILSFFYSCDKDNAFDNGATVAISGSITKTNGINVYLSKALNSTDEYYYNRVDSIFLINDAKIALHDINGELVKLKFDGKGVYSYKDTLWKPIENKEYKIVAEIPNYGKIESEWVLFPNKAVLIDISHKFKTITIETGQVFLSADMEILIDSADKSDYYQLEYKVFDENKQKVESLFPLYSKLTEKESFDCGATYVYNGVIFTRNCLKSNIFYNLVGLKGYIPQGNNLILTDVDSMAVSLNTVSESYHKYRSNIARQDLIDERFQEIPPSYTNIKNGIGIFYAVNEGDKTFTIKP